MPPAGFELAIPAGERLQTDALDRAATGIGRNSNTACIFGHSDKQAFYGFFSVTPH